MSAEQLSSDTMGATAAGVGVKVGSMAANAINIVKMRERVIRFFIVKSSYLDFALLIILSTCWFVMFICSTIVLISFSV